MAFEIVDGMTGTKHISSDDLSALNIATVGRAFCVLKYGDDFNLTMASANSAILGTGVGMVGGKRFWNQAATNLTIQSGTQGQKRNDLIVARYAKTSAGIESITPVVIKGTPTTGTPADPAITNNDLRLWRVPLNGISVGTPVKLFDPVTPLATLGDSVYPKRGTLSPVAGWLLDNWVGQQPGVYINGNMATLYGTIIRAAVEFTGPAWDKSFDIGRVSPRPKFSNEQPVFVNGPFGLNDGHFLLKVDTNGTIFARAATNFTLHNGDGISLDGYTYIID